MLVCPHCQFENPDTHRFCQKCGESLTEKACPVCATSVTFEAEYCPNCCAATGIAWKAILSPSLTRHQVEDLRQTTLPPSQVPAGVSALLNSGYLDPHQRYQILTSSPNSANPLDLEVKVLDCQPLRPSRLEASYSAHLDSESIADICQILEVPSTAQLYLELREFYPALPLPRLHDAWTQDALEIILLEDWSHLPCLIDFWQDEQAQPIQVLHWLYEMIELWAVLQSKNCCQSLLVLDNLRVDEDSLLCLQRLYLDRPKHPPVLQNLGRLWQKVFQQLQLTQRDDLAQLYTDLEAGIVDSLEQLRLRIEKIAMTLQPELPTMATPTNAPDPLNPFMMDDTNLDSALDSETCFDENPDLTEPVTAPLDPEVAPPPLLPKLVPPISETAASQRINPSKSEPLPPVADAAIELPTASEEEFYEGDDSPTIVLPMRLVSLEDAGATDIGRQRDHNEDCFSIQTQVKKLEGSKGRSLQARGLYILCDGMGGHAGGEIASALAVETLQTYFTEHWQEKLPSYEIIRAGIHQANIAIYDRNQENARSGSGRMGTTLVLVLVQDTEAAIAHVGDSRLYRFSRRRGLEPLTVDHEVGQREIQRGVEPAIAYARPDAYQLTQALGPRDENFVNPDIRFLELNEDMLLLLCSDGLTDNNLLETHWRTHIEPLLGSQNNLEQGVHQLIDLANQQNGHDNITALAIRAKVRPNLDQFDPR
ncbi:MAG: serine/threonine phosphatase [Leptolyngbyaceae cyanobacterium CRU_2_3]|nr:serine/threonine phosphatase [Leptolyngbyaceae cyanobacterium CRU_2_3]